MVVARGAVRKRIVLVLGVLSHQHGELAALDKLLRVRRPVRISRSRNGKKHTSMSAPPNSAIILRAITRSWSALGHLESFVMPMLL